MSQYPQRPGEAENCRDFLRTGRCKYGDSCKYHHPPNVQNGGGVRAPLNPGEPPFPIRRGEPSCQYYLKHGTCKFGQTCKFNHPPMSPKQAATLAANASGSPFVLSNDNFLPQRPTEPDCIYFLRNGRCKYGSTCKYHHPLTIDEKKLRERSHSTGSILDLHGTSHLTFGALNGATAIPVHIIDSNGLPHGQTHIILNDGKIALMINPSSHETNTTSGTTQISSSYASSSSNNLFYTHHQVSTPPSIFSSGFSSSISSYETHSTLDSIGRTSSHFPNNMQGGGVSNLTSSPALSSLTPHHSASQNSLNLNDYVTANNATSSPPRSATIIDQYSGMLHELEPSSLTPQTSNLHPSTPTSLGWKSEDALSPMARSWESAARFPYRQESRSIEQTESTEKFNQDKGNTSAFSPRATTRFNTPKMDLGPEAQRKAPSRRVEHLSPATRSMHAHDEDAETYWDDDLTNMTSALLSMMDTSDEIDRGARTTLPRSAFLPTNNREGAPSSNGGQQSASSNRYTWNHSYSYG